MNLRNLLALEPGFEPQPLGPALPRGQAIPLPPPERLLPSGVVIAADGKMRTAFVRGEHYSQWRYGNPEYKISGSRTGRMSSSASAFQNLPRRTTFCTSDGKAHSSDNGWMPLAKNEYLPEGAYYALLSNGQIVRCTRGMRLSDAIAWRSKKDTQGSLAYEHERVKQLAKPRPDDASTPYKVPARYSSMDANAVMAAALATSGDELPSGWKPFDRKNRVGEFPKELLMRDGKVVQWQDRALYSPQNCVAWR